jgi:iron complex transport system permease protein
MSGPERSEGAAHHEHSLELMRPEPGLARAGRGVVRGRTAGRAGLPRAVAVGVVLAAALAVTCAVAVSVGEFRIPLPDVVRALLGGADPGTAFVVRELRLPRVLTGAAVGAALGLSGAIFQALARNPLASPDVVGVTAGASTAAVAVIVLGAGGFVAVSLGAGAGALGAALLVYLLAYRAGVSPYRLILVGIGVGAGLNALTAFLLTRSEIWDAQQAMIWLVGNLNERGWKHVWLALVPLAVLLPATMWLSEPLRVLLFGDDTARGLGLRVEAVRGGLVIAGVALAAAAVAAAGPIPFVAFLAPAIARRLVAAPVSLLPAALAGALLTTSSDVAGRVAAGSTELPVGVVTGVVGAPYLLWLLARANRIGRGG